MQACGCDSRILANEALYSVILDYMRGEHMTFERAMSAAVAEADPDVRGLAVWSAVLYNIYYDTGTVLQSHRIELAATMAQPPRCIWRQAVMATHTNGRVRTLVALLNIASAPAVSDWFICHRSLSAIGVPGAWIAEVIADLPHGCVSSISHLPILMAAARHPEFEPMRRVRDQTGQPYVIDVMTKRYTGGALSSIRTLIGSAKVVAQARVSQAAMGLVDIGCIPPDYDGDTESDEEEEPAPVLRRDADGAWRRGDCRCYSYQRTRYRCHCS